MRGGQGCGTSPGIFLQTRKSPIYLVKGLVAYIRFSLSNAPAKVTPPTLVISPMNVRCELVALRIIAREVGDTKNDAAFAVLKSVVCFDGFGVCIPECRRQGRLICHSLYDIQDRRELFRCLGILRSRDKFHVILLIQKPARQVCVGSIDVYMLVILLADVSGDIINPK